MKEKKGKIKAKYRCNYNHLLELGLKVSFCKRPCGHNIRHAEKCREGKRNVEKCREMKRNSEKCREMKKHVEKFRYTHDLYDLYDTRECHI